MAVISTVIDTSQNPSSNNLRMFFRRSGPTSAVSRRKWLNMLVAEAIFGEELLENLVICCAAGKAHTLNRLVPRGIFIDQFREILVEVLFLKYTLQYCLLNATNPGALAVVGTEANATQVNFELRNGVAYQIIYFRRVYHLLFFVGNIVLNVLLYAFHDSVVAALASFTILQLFRRAKL